MNRVQHRFPNASDRGHPQHGLKRLSGPGPPAALWESLSQNHPSIDGNKRTAFAVMYTFLVVNGTRLTASSDETEQFVLDLYAAGTFDFEHLSQWLRGNVSV
jgi:death-on-curing protein